MSQSRNLSILASYTKDTGTLRNAPRSISEFGSASIVPYIHLADQLSILSLAEPATVYAPTGAVDPIDGQRVTLRIKDNGTARALTWSTGAGEYRAIGIILPSTTVANKVMYVGCIYNNQDSCWDVVSVAQED
jgi:hypothetical protein